MLRQLQLKRYADRKGKTVHWGNIIGGFCGQEFIEEFATESQAKTREKQAKSGQAIPNDCKPIPKKKTVIR